MSTGDGVTHNTGIATELGGNVLDVQSGAQENVQSGGVLEIDAGGALEINNVDVTNAIAALANPISDNQKNIGLENVLIHSTGTWTLTRIAKGDISYRHTAANDTSVVAFDITEAIRTGANKGLKLASIDVMHKIGTAALDAHTATLSLVAFANNVANAVTDVPLTGSLNINTQSNPYVDNLVVTTPAFDNTANSKYVFELTVDAAASTAFDLYGLNLHFTKSQS